MQKCFDEKDIQMLQDVITKMDPTVSSFLELEVLYLFYHIYFIGHADEMQLKSVTHHYCGTICCQPS